METKVQFWIHHPRFIATALAAVSQVEWFIHGGDSSTRRCYHWESPGGTDPDEVAGTEWDADADMDADAGVDKNTSRRLIYCLKCHVACFWQHLPLRW